MESTISGSVRSSNGVTPLSGNGVILAFRGVTCDSLKLVKSVDISPADSSYIVDELSSGIYFLQAVMENNYVAEWWGEEQSSFECKKLSAIHLGINQDMNGKDFQLDLGASISGTIFESDGQTPVSLTQGYGRVCVYRDDPCKRYNDGPSTVDEYGKDYFNVVSIDSNDGTYIVDKLPEGDNFVSVHLSAGNYVDEWWSSLSSITVCKDSVPITLEKGDVVIDKDFQLDTGAVVTGTLFKNDGITPITDELIEVIAYSGSPCDSPEKMGWSYVDKETGSFRIENLRSGAFYLRPYVHTGNYIDEWWAQPLSSTGCETAQFIELSVAEVSSGHHFQLDIGSSVSGAVFFDAIGSPPDTYNSIYIRAYTGNPCGYKELVRSDHVDYITREYRIEGLLPGSYFLQADDNSRKSVVLPGCGYNGQGTAGGIQTIDNYFNEWWATPLSTTSCSLARQIEVGSQESLSNKDFQLSDLVEVPWDANQDGNITLYDILVSLQLLSNNNTYMVGPYVDVDNDDMITMPDIVHLLNELAEN